MTGKKAVAATIKARNPLHQSTCKRTISIYRAGKKGANGCPNTATAENSSTLLPTLAKLPGLLHHHSRYMWYTVATAWEEHFLFFHFFFDNYFPLFCKFKQTTCLNTSIISSVYICFSSGNHEEDMGSNSKKYTGWLNSSQLSSSLIVELATLEGRCRLESALMYL